MSVVKKKEMICSLDEFECILKKRFLYKKKRKEEETNC